MTSRSSVAIDLFSGGGALSSSLKAAGYHVAGAVEVCRHAAATYAANHPDVGLLRRDIRQVDGAGLKSVAPHGSVSLLAGCPPCQGFTSLTAKCKRSDPRNNLIREMARLVEELQPQAVMMENVPGLAGRGRALLEEFCGHLEQAHYVVTSGILQAADFGVPQYRRRLVILAGLGQEIELPEATHSQGGRNGLTKWATVLDAIGGLDPPTTLREAKQHSKLDRQNWHIVRSLSEANRARLGFARPGGTWRDIPESLRPACHQGGYRGFVNVYGRMAWDHVAPTITGGCTSLSKGRFGHPEENRTISVREAALLQTMPRDFMLATPYIDRACNIVGNAFPCRLAEAVARQCFNATVAAAG